MTLNPPSSSGRSGWERTLDISGHPYLESHVIGGKAVFPTAMIMECLAHAALHHHPGLEFVGLTNLRIFKGVRIARGDRQTVKVLTDKATRAGGEFHVPAQLVSDDGNREVLHAQAEIVLSAQRSPITDRLLLLRTADRSITPPDQWYDRLLFHGPQLHGLERIEALTSEGIVVAAKTAPAPAVWLTDPWRQAWIADPLAIDVALQAIIVWTQTVCERASLPTGIAGYRQYRRTFPKDGVRIVISAERRNEATVLADAELQDAGGEVVAAFSGIEYVLDAQLSAAFERNRLE